MLSVLRTAAPQQQSPDPKAKFKSVLGLGSSPGVSKDTDSNSVHRSSAQLAHLQSERSFSRRSVDTITDLQFKKKKRTERPTTPDIAFFEHDVVTVTKPVHVTEDDMRNVNPVTPQRRMPFRVDGQDGPWAISVAESPHDSTSYSVYVKNPTHNLTLTRTALEIVEMHSKLRDSSPSAKLPTLPIDASALPSPPPKRKSAFLNTLTRLASPSSNKTSSLRHASSKGIPSSAASSIIGVPASSSATPSTSPSTELNDPFTSKGVITAPTTPPPTNNIVTSLAAYLTTLANDPTIRQTRVWKRFVRVRTDDLQSVRVERAIKRVRSDLAAHSGSASQETRSLAQVLDEDAEMKSSTTSAAESTPANEPPKVNGDQESAIEASNDVQNEEEAKSNVDDGKGSVDDGEQERAPTPQERKPATPTPSTPIAETASTNSEKVNDEISPSTPVATDVSSTHSSRIPRSQSADPTSRASRIIYSPSSPLRGSPVQDGAASSTTSVTGDDSSISTTGRRSRKKRSKSVDPKKKLSQRKVVIDDFEMMRVLGKGCAGKVLLVRHKTTSDVFALKAITKRHVLAHQELQHTLTEQAVLKRMAAEGSDPFVVKLWWSFHDKENLFLVMDFHPGGDLATQLARWGRLGRDRARFYAAEIVEGVEGLHAAGVIYRDLKPENILIGGDGHIVLTDFGLSKEFPKRSNAITAPPTPSGFRGEFIDGSPTSTTGSPPWMKGSPGQDLATGFSANDLTSTFCGTAEYLAPEVIQGLPYSYEVDWWSFGTMLFEMLTGITPFWANNHSDMYYRVLQDELQFPDDRTMDQDTKSLIRGLLQRNPALRIKEPRIKKHPYFSMIDWSHVYYKRYIPPHIPPVDPSNATDTQNFDDTFLDMEPVIKDEDDEQTDTDQDRQTDADRTDGEDSVATPSQSRSPSVHPQEDETSVDVFDGYSFKGRHSVILDDEDDGDESEQDDEEDEESIQEASLDNLLPEEPVGTSPAEQPSTEITTVEEVPEPKTPEARPSALPEPTPVDATTPVETKPAPESNESKPAPQPPAAEAKPAVPSKPATEVIIKPPVPRSQPSRQPRSRREKSGIPALDRGLSDTLDEDGGATEREEDDDWDFVETNVNEERNGAKGTSLFARGVVDRYRLAVFRKSTPRRSGGGSSRNFSGMSVDSEHYVGSDLGDSPTPSDKQRRGRTPGLTFRRHPKQLLKAKSSQLQSPSSATVEGGRSSSHTISNSSKTLANSITSATFSSMASASSSAAGLLTPSPSIPPMTPSLKSKESATSMASPSEASSDQSLNGDASLSASIRNQHNGADLTVKGNLPATPSGDDEKQKSKGLKKYKEGAEKVLSIFQSPR
ncbi:hypothetical protein C8Q75DRAFT_807136 [Abortiporus biennis]|nr:hypothetical protein C8Q75DRAFT_807136 [Abortiporus biennis]